MAETAALTEDDYAELFDEVFEPGSASGGIITARRDNTADEWNVVEERRRSKKYMELAVRDGNEAAAIVAEGRRRGE